MEIGMSKCLSTAIVVVSQPALRGDFGERGVGVPQ
jgi:hypothetical protein